MADEQDTMTLEEAKKIIGQIARSGVGAQQLRALQMVSSSQGAATLPEPLSDAEVIDRLARLIRAAGPTASQLAYRRAYPNAKRPIHHASPKVLPTDVAPIDKASLPTTVKQLYRMFPEIKRGGNPPGFPRGSGLAVQKQWCQKKAYEMIMDREQAKHDQIVIAAEPEVPGV